jgi:hypothetical protein
MIAASFTVILAIILVSVAATSSTTSMDAADRHRQPPTVALVANAPSGIALGHGRNRPAQDVGKTWTQRQSAAETQFGSFEGHWRDYKPVNAAGTLNAAQTAALAAGKKLFINWKPCTSWEAAAAGKCDTAIATAARDWAAKCDDNSECWITFWHEPENDTNAAGRTTAYRSMFQHVSQLFRQQAPEVKIVWTMMGFSGHRALYPRLWPGPEYVDLIGHDPYIRPTSNPANLAVVIIDQASWLRANLPGAATKPVVAAEWGADLGGTAGTAQHRAAAINGVTGRLGEIAAAGHVELAMYDISGNSVSCGALTCPDAQAYKALKTATEG